MTGFVDTQDNRKDFKEKFAGSDAGPFVGVVKFTNDPTFQGRLGVNIPDITKTNDPTVEQVIWCQYLSPFYGAKPLGTVSKSDSIDHRGTQSSYGFWFVPPDVDTEVLVIFAKGEANRRNAFWIGCVQQPETNYQVPGYASSSEVFVAAEQTGTRAAARRSPGDVINYGTDFLPVAEKNRRLLDDGINSIRYPVQKDLAEQLLNQGLIQDTVRGTTSSSARRETPSRVFGVSTPGALRADSRTYNIGVAGSPVSADREIGHSFVMDDGDDFGENRQIRLRTGGGHQVLLNDDEGVIYIANKSGLTFLEMDETGRIAIYAQGGIALRTEADFNLHADKNIHFHARESIKFTAEKDINLNAEKFIHAMGDSGVLTASQNGSVSDFAKENITSFAKGVQLHGADGRIDLAGEQVHFNSVAAQETWGPGWMVPEHEKINIVIKEGLIDIESFGGIDETTGERNEVENKTSVADTTPQRGSWPGDLDPTYVQPSGQSFKAENIWDELEQLNPSVVSPGAGLGASSDLSQPQYELRVNQIIKSLGLQTPFMDKEFGVGNIEQKKKEFYEGLRKRQLYNKPDQAGAAFVTHEPWKRYGFQSESAQPVRFNFDPFYMQPKLRESGQDRGDLYTELYDNEWLELEGNLYGGVAASGSVVVDQRRNQLLNKFGLKVDPNFPGSFPGWNEAKAKFYKELKQRQQRFQSMSYEARQQVLEKRNDDDQRPVISG